MHVYVEGIGMQNLDPQAVSIARSFFWKNDIGYLACQKEDFLYILTIFEKLKKWNDLIVLCDENEQSDFYRHYRKDTIAFFTNLGFSEKFHEELDYHISFLQTYLKNKKIH
ncbi:hypothetical protein [Entomobacter blattae]|uniref:Uncharacterized protein n=1 Tax=Entomobacter blattae TaxID=2762277 RepID=A0A7H1NRI7_9PROT|nr:hypothetical protein [Entomobacter blattae]QNT78397.1 hypothetical protein JGUZn3_11710 [Entomobacter blattae]